MRISARWHPSADFSLMFPQREMDNEPQFQHKIFPPVVKSVVIEVPLTSECCIFAETSTVCQYAALYKRLFTS